MKPSNDSGRHTAMDHRILAKGPDFELRIGDRVLASGTDLDALKRLGSGLRRQGRTGVAIVTAEGYEVCSWL